MPWPARAHTTRTGASRYGAAFAAVAGMAVLLVANASSTTGSLSRAGQARTAAAMVPHRVQASFGRLQGEPAAASDGLGILETWNDYGLGSVSAPSAGVTTATCFGETATIVGTDGADTLTGTPGNDVIAGLGGNDQIAGGGGDDTICGGSGNDTILGQDGSDTLLGEAGNDTVDSGAGTTDLISGGAGDDVLTGNEFAAVSYIGSPAGVNVDLAQGYATGDGTDTLHGVESAFGSEHNDTLVGDAAGNFLAGMGGDDVIQGGDGFDVLLFVRSVNANLAAGHSSGLEEGNDSLSSIEGLAGGKTTTEVYDFTGNSGDNFLFTVSIADVGAQAPTATDWLHGGGGSDTIISDTGNDHLYGDAGNDSLSAGPGRNTIDGGRGSNDEVDYGWSGGGVRVNLARGVGRAPGTHDSLTRVESVAGSRFRDSLIGGRAANDLYGEAGNDRLSGLGGNDLLNGGPGSDSGNGGRGRGDFCLDIESPRGCEIRSGSAAAALPESVPGRGLKAVPLSNLIDAHSEPTCKPSRRGGRTSIGPPSRIKLRDDKVEWQAWLYKRGKSGPIFTTPHAYAKLVTPLGRTQTPSGWYTRDGDRVQRRIWSRRLKRGTYWWKEVVTTSPSGTHAAGKPLVYFQPPDSASTKPFSCKIR